jgi:cellulase/cellobiase CelA1
MTLLTNGVEPDSLANLVTNLNVAKCSNAEVAYKECVQYAITQLNLPNVSMYLDAGHAGWLGWAANIDPAATSSRRSTKLRVAPLKSEALRQMLPITTPGVSRLVLPILKEIPTAMRKNILML